MEEIDKLEHFTISRRRDGSLWGLGWGAMGVTYKERTGQNRSSPGQPRVLQPVPNQFHQGPRPAQSPVFVTQESYGRAKKEALRRHFDGLALNGTPKGTI
jgi:hypothetical protein